nr:hypothetical protein [Tanacetum cinerariifolium]
QKGRKARDQCAEKKVVTWDDLASHYSRVEREA